MQVSYLHDRRVIRSIILSNLVTQRHRLDPLARENGPLGMPCHIAAAGVSFLFYSLATVFLESCVNVEHVGSYINILEL